MKLLYETKIVGSCRVRVNKDMQEAAAGNERLHVWLRPDDGVYFVPAGVRVNSAVALGERIMNWNAGSYWLKLPKVVLDNIDFERGVKVYAIDGGTGFIMRNRRKKYEMG